MKRINYSYAFGELTKGAADDLFENEHNAATLNIVFDWRIDLDDYNFVVQFHTPDCRRPRHIADFDATSRTVSLLLPSDVMCAGRVEFDLEGIVSDENGNVTNVVKILSSDFTVKPAICPGEEGETEYTDGMRNLEQKYSKARRELELLINNVINNILPLSQSRLSEALDYVYSQTDTTITLTEQACATLRTELVNLLTQKMENGDFDGATPSITIGEVTVADSSSPASVYITGTAQNVVLNFRLPKADLTVNGQSAINGNINLTYKDLEIPSYVQKEYPLDVALPQGMIVGENGGYFISLSGGIGEGLVGGRSALMVRKPNGELRDMCVISQLNTWDKAELYLPGKIDVGEKTPGLYTWGHTYMSDISASSWVKRINGNYTEFYTTSFVCSRFDKNTESPHILSEHFRTYSPSHPNPDTGEWMLTLTDEGYICFVYGGNFVGDASDFASILQGKGQIIYTTDQEYTSYDSNAILDIRGGDTLSIVSANEVMSIHGTITIAELPYYSEQNDIDADGEDYGISVKDNQSVHIPQDNLTKYALVSPNRRLMCRGENMFPPMIKRYSTIKSSVYIPVLPNKKYYYRFFSNTVTAEDFTLKEYNSSKQLIATKQCKNYFFITESNTKYVVFEAMSWTLNPDDFRGMMSDKTITAYLPYKETYVHNRYIDGEYLPCIRLINGGELITLDGIAYNATFKRKRKVIKHRLSEPYTSGEFNPYGVMDEAMSKVTVYGGTSQSNQDFEGYLYFYHDGNQYDPYKRMSPVSEYDGRTVIENYYDGWIKAYNTQADKLIIRDIDAVKLHPNTKYVLGIDYGEKIGTISPVISAVDGNGNTLSVSMVGSWSNRCQCTVTTADNEDVYFTFSFSDVDSTQKSLTYRVNLFTGITLRSYEPYQNPDVLHIDSLAEGESRSFVLRDISPMQRGWISLKSKNDATGSVEIMTETEYKIIAFDKITQSVSTYSRSNDMYRKPFHGLRMYKIMSCRDNSTSVHVRRYKSDGTLNISEAATSVGPAGAIRENDIIVVYGR